MGYSRQLQLIITPFYCLADVLHAYHKVQCIASSETTSFTGIAGEVILARIWGLASQRRLCAICIPTLQMGSII